MRVGKGPLELNMLNIRDNVLYHRYGVSMVPIGRNNFELNASIALRDVYRLFLVFSGDERGFRLVWG